MFNAQFLVVVSFLVILGGLIYGMGILPALIVSAGLLLLTYVSLRSGD